MHQVPRLTIARIPGDPDVLLGRYHESATVMDDVGRDNGLILHAVARTDDGLMIVNVWDRSEGSETAALDPRRLAALGASGVDPEAIVREHHAIDRHVVTAPWVPTAPSPPPTG